MKHILLLITTFALFLLASPLNGMAQKTETRMERLEKLGKKASKKLDYNVAIQYYEKVAELQKETLGEKHPDYATTLEYIGNEYKHWMKWDKALPYFLHCAEIRKETLGENNLDYLRTLESIGSIYRYSHRYHKSIEYYTRCAELKSKFFGVEQSLPTLYELSCVYAQIGDEYKEQGDHKKALEYYNLCCETNKKSHGDGYPSTTSTLKNIGDIYYSLEDYSKALDYYTRCATLLKKRLGSKYYNNEKTLKDYATVLDYIGDSYYFMEDYNKALEHYLLSAKVKKKIFGKDNPDYTVSLIALGDTYSSLKDYTKALAYYHRYLEINEKTNREDDPNYASALFGIGHIYLSQNDYINALEYYHRYIEIIKKTHREDDPYYAPILLAIGNIYFTQKDYINALEYYKRYIETNDKSYGEEFIVELITSIGSIYCLLGDYPSALQYLQKAEKKDYTLFHSNELFLGTLANIYQTLGTYRQGLDVFLDLATIQKKKYGEKATKYANTLNHVAWAYLSLQDYDKALKYAEHVLDIQKETKREEGSTSAQALFITGSVYHELGNDTIALDYFNRAATIQSKSKRHQREYASTLTSIGDIYLSMNEYKKALEQYDIAEGIISTGTRTQNDITDYVDYKSYFSLITSQLLAYFHLQDTLNHKKVLAKMDSLTTAYGDIESNLYRDYIYIRNHDFSRSSHFCIVIEKMIKEYVSTVFSLMTEREREVYWKESNYSIYSKVLLYCYYIAYRVASDTTTATAYDMALFTKGLLLSSSIEFNKVIAESGNAKALQIYDELLSIQKNISLQQQKPVSERTFDIEKAEREAEQLEAQLVTLSKEFGDFTKYLKLSWRDVQAALSDRDVAIEFIDFTVSEDSTVYAALVLRKGWTAPKMIPLFEENQLRQLSDAIKNNDKNSINKFYNNSATYDLIWGPLENILQEGDTIYFSASGLFHKLGIEYLPLIQKKDYTVRRLSSTKQLCMENTELSYNGAVLYGGLEYDTDDKTKIEESKKAQKNGYTASSMDSKLMADITRGAYTQSWEFLPGTKMELDSIHKLYESHGLSHEVYTGSSGVEETFKMLSGRNAPLIFVATHGFFIPESQIEKNTFMQKMLFNFGGNSRSEKPDLAMQRSGLIMAGGNDAWMGESVPEGVEDGILTAQEVSELDLRGTGLVVLSACETGLGDVSGEGVFGLQRGFKKAGAQTIVMSLWQVSDNATNLMMSTFFQHLLNGESKYDAFRSAQEAVREEYRNPYFWAAFIMLD